MKMSSSNDKNNGCNNSEYDEDNVILRVPATAGRMNIVIAIITVTLTNYNEGNVDGNKAKVDIWKII